jgi:hypothetical protein
MGNNQSSDFNDDSYDDALKRIMGIVESGYFDGVIGRTKKKKIIQNEDYVDKNKPLKNMATDFVVNEFFSTEESLYCFIQYVYESFDNMLKVYRSKNEITKRQLFFVYKGGNIMRIISNEFLLELPAVASNKLGDYYRKFFKRSDADFSIYIDPKIPNYDKVHHEIGVMSYLMLVHIRDVFLKNPETYFDFMKYSTKYRKKVLLDYLDKFNEIGTDRYDNLVFLKTGATDNKDYASRADYFVVKDPNYDENKTGLSGEIMDSKSYMIASYNTAHDFKRSPTSPRIVFSLCRTKIGFNLFKDGKRKSVEGELIDVSIPSRESPAIGHFFDELVNNVSIYNLKYKDKETKFMSYSLDYLIQDLENILFVIVDFPWEDEKYEKRINRLFYLYFVDAFINAKSGNSRVKIFRKFKRMVIAPYMNNPQSNQLKAKAFEEEYQKCDLQITNIVKHLDKMMNNYDKIQEGGFKDMLKIMDANCDVLIGALASVHRFCRKDGFLDEEDIYDSSMEELI